MSRPVTEEARARKRARDAAKKRADRKTVNGLGQHQARMSWEPSKEALAERRKLIPPDTRDLTARLMGDPLVGRRAIDMRGVG